MTRHFPLATLLLAFALAPSAAAAQSFSIDPLRLPAAWPENDLPRTAEGLTSWLTARRNQIEGDQHEMVRGQIYAVVADHVRKRFAAGGGTAIPADDRSLGQLLVEADRLDIAGAAPVADRIGAQAGRVWTAVQADEYQLVLDGELFTLAAKTGRWTVRFPWYWMLSSAGRSTRAEAPSEAFDMAGLRLLMTANEPPLTGAAQPGVLLFSGDGEVFQPWLFQFGVSARDSVAPVVPNATRSYQHRDVARHQQAEVSLFKTSTGWFLVGYFGPDGPYRANRSQYLDLLRTVQVR